MEKEILKTYISAPITGYDVEKRKRYFQQVANQLAEHGFTPVNPMKNGIPVTASHATHMRADIHLLLTCRYIVQALDSASSHGCDIEEQVADACGIQNIGCIFTDGTLKLNTQGKKIRNWAKWRQIRNEKKKTKMERKIDVTLLMYPKVKEKEEQISRCCSLYYLMMGSILTRKTAYD